MGRRFRTIPVGEATFRRASELKARVGASSWDELVALLINAYGEYVKVGELLKELNSRVSRVEELLTKLVATGGARGRPTGTEHVAPAGKTGSRGSEGSAGSRVRCRPKSEVRDIEAYVKKLEKEGALVDWWDEGDSYCFELRA